jgi:hypothetical protein
MNEEKTESHIDTADVLAAEEFQELYEEQQRRMACPGCGEEPFLG